MSLIDTALLTIPQAKAYLKVDASASLKIEAEYVGMGDGVTKIFGLDWTPITGSLKLYNNGILQTELTHWTISDKTITFITAPTLNHPITASYDKAASPNTFESYDDSLLEQMLNTATDIVERVSWRAFIKRTVTEVQVGDGEDELFLKCYPVDSITSVSDKRVIAQTGDGSTKAFDLGSIPKSLTVYVDGILKTITTDYTLSGQIITFIIAPVDGAKLIFRFEVGLDLVSDYGERLQKGRLYGSWLKNYEYVIVYTAGDCTALANVQSLYPEAIEACLLILADLFENRGDTVDSVNISGLGSTSYKLPSRAEKLLSSLKPQGGFA